MTDMTLFFTTHGALALVSALFHFALVTAQAASPGGPAVDNSRYNYTEFLTLKPLPRNQLLASFDFESYSDEFVPSSQGISDNYIQYGVFPRSIGQVLQQTSTNELHLRFSQGWWDAEGWGSQPRNGSFAGGIGVELWAWVEGNTVAEAESHWSKLVNSLSGLFCASLNFIDSAQTTYPKKSFQYQGNVKGKSKPMHLLRGALPREPVCTENLTPFIKLLPCKGKAGISSLLDGHKIFDAQWQGMAIDVIQICDRGKCKWKLTQVIDAIIDIPRSLRRKTSAVPKPVSGDELRCDPTKPYNSVNICFPLGDNPEQRYKLSDIFGRSISGKCPVTRNEKQVGAIITENWEAKIHSGDTPGVVYTTGSNEFSLKTSNWYDIELETHNSTEVADRGTPPIYVERSFTGYGQDRGGMRTVFTNTSPDKSVRYVYFETLPWYMRLYLHTMELENASVNPAFAKLFPSIRDNIIQDILYRPAIDRKRPTQIEIEMILPPSGSVSLSYDFEKTLLYIEEYPPDANHGFEIPPGALTTLPLEGEVDFQPVTMRTTSLLLSLPTPDFSMPYNVIILTCTVMALAFGSIFNLIVKRIVTDEEADLIARSHPIRLKLLSIIEKVKSKFEKPKRGPFPYTPREERQAKDALPEKSEKSEKAD